MGERKVPDYTDAVLKIDRALENADVLDVQVGGDDQATWIAPSGETGLSFKHALRLMMESGIGFETFETKAQLTASSLANGKYAIVTNDGVANTGVYLKKSNVWIKVDWHSLDKVDSYTINSGKAYPLLQTTRNGIKSNAPVALNTLILDVNVFGAKTGKYYRVDIIANGNSTNMHPDAWQISEHDIASFATTDSFGKYVVEKEVAQQRISGDSIQKITIYSTDRTLRFEFVVDPQALPARGIFVRALINSDDGYSWIINPITYSFDDISVKSTHTISTFKTDNVSRRWYEQATSTAMSQINAQRIYDKDYAPLPMQLVPQQYDVPNSIINSIKFTQGDKISLETFYVDANGHVVHPYALEFWDKFAGHRYWLGITPYQNRAGGVENPFIYVSDDLRSFKYLETVQPIADTPPKPLGAFMTYNSDVFFVYDHFAGELLCCWRYSNHPTDGTTVNVQNGLFARATKDGTNWSAPKVIYPISTGDLLLSPSILYDFVNQQWVMYYVSTDPSDSINKITYRTTKTLGQDWSAPTYIANPTGIAPWHLEVKYIGKRLGMLVHDNTAQQLYFGISTDGKSWAFGGGIIQGEFNGVYKSSFTTVFNNANQVAVRVFWTTFNKAAASNDPEDMQLHINQSDYINLVLE